MAMRSKPECISSLKAMLELFQSQYLNGVGECCRVRAILSPKLLTVVVQQDMSIFSTYLTTYKKILNTEETQGYYCAIFIPTMVEIFHEYIQRYIIVGSHMKMDLEQVNSLATVLVTLNDTIETAPGLPRKLLYRNRLMLNTCGMNLLECQKKIYYSNDSKTS